MGKTPGGNRLRMLRERAGKTQLVVELEAELGSGYLQRLEAGKVVKPERETLERILAALEATYSERRHLLELFGYVVRTPLPNEAEVNWALSVCRNELSGVTFPAYVLDCAHRLLAYNPYFPRLLGVKPDGLRMARLRGSSMFRAWFDPAFGLAAMLENRDEFLSLQIQALKYERQLFWNEEWYEQVLDELRRNVPLFNEYWQADSYYAVAARPVVPVGLHVPGKSLLYFRLTSETFIQDFRFRIIYYLPADANALQACADWTEELGIMNDE